MNQEPQTSAEQPDPFELIIESRRPQNSRWKLLFWMLMAYLLMPLLTAVGWLLGAKIAYTEVVEVAGYQGFGWKTMLLTIIVIGLLLKGWSMYNYARFARSGRRQVHPPLSPQTLSEDFEKSFEVHTDTLSDWQESAYVSLKFDDDGHIASISPLDEQPKDIPEQLDQTSETSNHEEIS